jgi:hypothetical protein
MELTHQVCKLILIVALASLDKETLVAVAGFEVLALAALLAAAAVWAVGTSSGQVLVV